MSDWISELEEVSTYIKKMQHETSIWAVGARLKEISKKYGWHSINEKPEMVGYYITKFKDCRVMKFNFFLNNGEWTEDNVSKWILPPDFPEE